MKELPVKTTVGGFTLALLLLFGVGVESYFSIQKLIENRRWVEHTHQVLDKLDKISDGMELAERGQRGYTYLKDDRQLTVFQEGTRETAQAVEATRQLTHDNPDQQHQLDKLAPLITKRLALLKQIVSLRQQKTPNRTIQSAIVEETLRLQQEIQAGLQAMQDTEQRLLQLRRTKTDASIHQAVLAGGISYLLSFCLLIGVFFLLQKQIRIRKQAEIDLQKHAQEVYDLYNQAPCGYHSLNTDGIYLRINDTELNWLGYTRDEVLQKKFIDFVTPKSLLVFQENFSKFKEQGRISDLEFELVRRDGTTLPVSLSATAIKDADGNFVMSRSTLFDIRDRKRAELVLQQANEQLEAKVQERTAELAQVNASLQLELAERKRAEQALLQSEKQLRTITNALPVLISYIDSDHRYRFNNRAYEEWFGYSQTEVVGQHLRDVLGESAYQEIEPYLNVAFSGRMVVYESPIAYRRGKTCWVSATYIPDFDESGDVKGCFTMIADITDRKLGEQQLQNAKEELEAKVQERTAELNSLNQDLLRSNQELEQFAYIASHDLQEPLRAVAGYTQLLVDDNQGRLNESAEEYAAYIMDGAKRMQQLIQDLLAYSRVGTCELTCVPTNCNAVLRQVLRTLQITIAEAGATITVDPLPTVIADKNQLVQLFQNLLGNAIKFHREEPPQVHISAELNDGEWLFQVRDNGIGIKSRYLDRIFEIFKRLHTRTEFSGTGIGLAICKKIVDRHKGRIWAESEPSVGTTFYFTIPHHS